MIKSRSNICRGCKLLKICTTPAIIIIEEGEVTCPCTICLIKTMCELSCDKF
jgi:hypothetical protein